MRRNQFSSAKESAIDASLGGGRRSEDSDIEPVENSIYFWQGGLTIIVFLIIAGILIVIGATMGSGAQSDHAHSDLHSLIQPSEYFISENIITKRITTIEHKKPFFNEEQLRAFHLLNRIIVYNDITTTNIKLPPSIAFTRDHGRPPFTGFSPPFYFLIVNNQDEDIVVDVYDPDDETLLCVSCPVTIPEAEAGGRAYFEVFLGPMIDNTKRNFPLVEELQVVVRLIAVFP